MKTIKWHNKHGTLPKLTYCLRTVSIVEKQQIKMLLIVKASHAVESRDELNKIPQKIDSMST